VVLVAIALITLLGMLLLVSCWEQERGSFGDIAERALGKPGRILIDSCLVLAQVRREPPF
jgi:amino acid permease